MSPSPLSSPNHPLPTDEKAPRLSTSTTSTTSTYLAKLTPSDPSSEKQSKTDTLRKMLHLKSKSEKDAPTKTLKSRAERDEAIQRKEIHYLALSVHASSR